MGLRERSGSNIYWCGGNRRSGEACREGNNVIWMSGDKDVAGGQSGWDRECGLRKAPRVMADTVPLLGWVSQPHLGFWTHKAKAQECGSPTGHVMSGKALGRQANKLPPQSPVACSDSQR